MTFFAIEQGEVIRDDNGTPVRMYGTTQDITIQKGMQEALRKSEEQYRLIAENSLDLITLHVPNGGPFVYVSPSVQNLLGYTPEELVGTLPLDLVYPDDRESMQPGNVQEIVRTNPAGIFKMRLMHKDGSRRFFESKISPIFHPETGQMTMIQTLGRDVTERVMLEEQVRATRDFYVSLVASVDTVLWEAHPDTHQVTYISPKAKELFGYDPNEWSNDTMFWRDHIHPEDRERTFTYAEEQTRIADSYTIEYRLVKSDNTTVWVRDVVRVIREDGHPVLLRGALVDISVVKQAEHTLRTSEANLRAVFDASVQIHYLIDTDYHIITFNTLALQRVRESLGRDILPHEDVRNLIQPDHIERFEYYYQQALQNTSHTYQNSVTFPQVGTFWFEFSYTPVKDSSGAIIGVSFSALDITERIRREEMIRMSESNLQAIMDSAIQAFWLVDKNLKIIAYNRNVARSVRQIFNKDIQLGDSITEYVAPNQMEKFMDSVTRALSGEHIIYEEQFTAGDVSQWVELLYLPTLDKNGNIIGVTLSTFDVTERKTMLLQMAEYSQELESIIDSMLDGLVLVDEHQRILLVNPSIQTIFGYKQQELIGQPISMLVPERFRSNQEAAMDRLIYSDDKAIAQRISTAKGLHADGHEFNIDASIATFTSGSSKKLLAIVRDITEQLQAQEEILSLNRTLESRVEERTKELSLANQEKSELLGIAAHDLKNPLAGIYSSAQILERYFGQDEQSTRFIKMILSASEQMLSIITNLLESNRIESGRLSLVLKKVNLAEYIEPIAEQYQETASNKGIFLHYTPVENRESYWIIADDFSLRQIVDNLISNAVKYTPHWKNIWVTVAHRITESGQPVARLEVKDEGPGLTEEDKQKLFGKFARLSAQPTGGENSTGLGLSIVKKLVELQNGKIWCESRYGNGATFIVELPSAQLLPTTE